MGYYSQFAQWTLTYLSYLDAENHNMKINMVTGAKDA